MRLGFVKGVGQRRKVVRARHGRALLSFLILAITRVAPANPAGRQKVKAAMIHPRRPALSRFSSPLIFPQDLHEKMLIEQLGAFDVHVERETELVDFTLA